MGTKKVRCSFIGEIYSAKQHLELGSNSLVMVAVKSTTAML